MQISQRGIALLKQCEGFSATEYICPAGKRTIGYGHVITASEHYVAMDEAQAEALLIRDTGTAQQAVSDYVQIDLTQNQFDALVVFIYNIGVSAFARSTLLKNLNANDLKAALTQWQRWIYAAGKPSDGLKSRRQAEMTLFQEND